jgi:hypothetical protein
MFPLTVKLTIAAGLAMAGLTLVPAGSMAGLRAGPLEYEPMYQNAASFSGVSAVALCSAPQQVVGGGGAIAGGGLTPSEQETNLTAIAPHDGSDLDTTADDGYVTSAYNDSATSRKVRTMAICFDEPSSLSYAKNASTSASGEFSQAVACSSGKLIGGGGYVEGPHLESSRLRGSYPFDDGDGNDRADDGWAYAATRESGPGGAIAAHAVCIKGGEPETRYRAKARIVGPGKTRVVKVACPRRFHAAGGGVSGEPGIRSSLPFDGPDAGDAPDDGWRVTVHNADDGEQPIEARTTCLG